MITKENIFEEAKKSNLEVLKSDLVDKVKDSWSWTPLHELAYLKVKEVMSHPSVDKVKDKYIRTPLHYLAYVGVKDVLDHPSVDQIKDNFGYTPLHHLARYSSLFTKEDLRKKYPWYKKEIGSVYEAVEEIINIPTSVRFILEDS